MTAGARILVLIMIGFVITIVAIRFDRSKHNQNGAEHRSGSLELWNNQFDQPSWGQDNTVNNGLNDKTGLFEAGYHAGQLSTLPVVTIKMDSGGYVSGAHFDFPTRFMGDNFIVTRCSWKYDTSTPGREQETALRFDNCGGSGQVLISHCYFDQRLDRPLGLLKTPWRP